MAHFNDEERELFIKQQAKLAIRRRKGHQAIETLYESINEAKDKILMETKIQVKSEDIPKLEDPFKFCKEEDLKSEVDTAFEEKIRNQILLCDILIKKVHLKKKLKNIE